MALILGSLSETALYGPLSDALSAVRLAHQSHWPLRSLEPCARAMCRLLTRTHTHTHICDVRQKMQPLGLVDTLHNAGYDLSELAHGLRTRGNVTPVYAHVASHLHLRAIPGLARTTLEAALKAP